MMTSYSDWACYKSMGCETDPEKLMRIYVAWQSYDKNTPNRGFWDQQMLEDAFSRTMWNPVGGHDFEHVNGIAEVPRNIDGCIAIVHARSCAHEMWANKLSDDLMRFKWTIIALVSDEEGSFPAFQVKHHNMRMWMMMPNERKHLFKNFGLPNGYPSGMKALLKQFKQEQIDKKLDWFFSGQDTHHNRHILVEYGQAIGGMPGLQFNSPGVLIPTDGFTKGLPREEYYKLMSMAKIAPCPAGAYAPDSFRFYEALEAGCVPLADNHSDRDDWPSGYWNNLFAEKLPFPLVDEWRYFPKLLLDTLAGWPANSNKIGAWWMNYKRDFVYRIEQEINEVSGKSSERTMSTKDKITVIVSSSPIPSHPDPYMILETIDSVRGHLPDSEIIIMQDGIRPEQESQRVDYEEYKRRLLIEIRDRYHNVLPIFFDEFLHQAEMTRRTLDKIKTPMLLFMEHDTPLVEEKSIEWDGIVRAIESGWTDSVRFHHINSDFIHPEHMHMAIDKCRQDVQGIQLVRTRQYSQRPHVATVDYYRRLLSLFSAECRTFIEDKAYGVISEGDRPSDWKMSVYTPDGPIKRSRDLNGREGKQPKFDDRLVF